MNTTSMQLEQAQPLETAEGLNPGQVAVITQQTPQNLIFQRKGRNGKTFSYVPHNYVTELLNQAFNHAWSFETEVLEAFCTANEVTVKGRLVVLGRAGKKIIKEQFGNQDILKDKSSKPAMSFGDALKGASSDALRKCASLLGIALDLYGEPLPPPQPVEPITEDQRRQILDLIENPIFTVDERKKAKTFVRTEPTHNSAGRFIDSLLSHIKERNEETQEQRTLDRLLDYHDIKADDRQRFIDYAHSKSGLKSHELTTFVSDNFKTLQAQMELLKDAENIKKYARYADGQAYHQDLDKAKLLVQQAATLDAELK